MTKMINKPHQGDLYSVVSHSCWSYDFDEGRILINERYPLEEIKQDAVLVAIEETSLPYNTVFGVDQKSDINMRVPLLKVISPSGKIGWVLMRHLRRL